VTETAVAQGGPPPLRGIRVVSVTEASDRVVVNTESDAGASEFYARVVVIAAGAAGRNLIADRVRLSSHVYPDRYLMVDVVHAPSQPDDAAVIHLDQDGVLESFPLPGGGRRLVAWDSNTGKSILNSHTDSERLQRAVAQRTGDEALAAQVTSASSFGIRRALLHRLRIGRVIAIGDTAHEVSPIGGQGMNLGLLDAVTLATPLSHWLRDEQASRELDRWEQRRLKSARTAVRLASLNTALGRSRSRGSSRASSLTVGVLLRSPLSQLATRAYAMGFDADA
jgi:2-polyprenyl-6-methoxyphenol hydroxylase-like FAD-dependent oxidoreductase